MVKETVSRGIRDEGALHRQSPSPSRLGKKIGRRSGTLPRGVGLSAREARGPGRQRAKREGRGSAPALLGRSELGRGRESWVAGGEETGLGREGKYRELPFFSFFFLFFSILFSKAFF